MDNKIAAVVVSGEAIDSNRFVDDIKEMTGLEMTVFDKDVRVATTLKERGKRATGTRLTNSYVIREVLQEGNTIKLDATLFSRPYKTLY